jgi:hypothetical protein
LASGYLYLIASERTVEARSAAQGVASLDFPPPKSPAIFSSPLPILANNRSNYRKNFAKCGGQRRDYRPGKSSQIVGETGRHFRKLACFVSGYSHTLAEGFIGN